MCSRLAIIKPKALSSRQANWNFVQRYEVISVGGSDTECCKHSSIVSSVQTVCQGMGVLQIGKAGCVRTNARLLWREIPAIHDVHTCIQSCHHSHCSASSRSAKLTATVVTRPWIRSLTSSVSWAREGTLANKKQTADSFYVPFSTVWLWVKPHWGFLTFSPNSWGIFSSNFTRLLYVPIYVRLQIVIQLSATLTKLCHIKRDHPVHIICSMSTIGRNTRVQMFAKDIDSFVDLCLWQVITDLLQCTF